MKIFYFKDLKACINYYEGKQHRNINVRYYEIKMKTTIYKLPKILIINFNRVYDKYHLNYLVEYPEYFDINEYFEEKPNLIDNSFIDNKKYYSLNGVIIHYGTANSGHKTAFCKNFFNDNWYFFNDSSKFKINYLTKDILDRKDAFILVYQNSSIDISDDCKKK